MKILLQVGVLGFTASWLSLHLIHCVPALMAFCNSSMFVTSFCVLDSFRIPCIIILPASSSSLTDCQLASTVLSATIELHVFISSPHSTQTGSRALAIHGFSSQVRNRCLLASVHFVFWAPLLLVLIDCVDSSLLSSLRIGLIFTLDPLFTALCCSSVTSPLSSITSIIEVFHYLHFISSASLRFTITSTSSHRIYINLRRAFRCRR